MGGWCSATAIACQDGQSEVTTQHGPKKVRDILPGDYILTLDSGNKTAFTKVVHNPRSLGLLNFVEIVLTDGSAFNVTDNHVVVTGRGVDFNVSSAGDVLQGHVMLTTSGPMPVKSVRKMTQSEKWPLVTNAGTVLVNGVLTTTICGESLQTLPPQFPEAIAQWRRAHDGPIVV